MIIRKNLLIDRFEYYFLFLFPFSVIFFNPSKEFLGVLSITDVFVGLSLLFFMIYLTIKRVKINNYFLLLIVLIIFSFLSLIINEKFEFIDKIKYQLRWGFYLSVFIIIYNYINSKSLNYFKKGLYKATFIVCIYALLQTFFKEQMIPTIFWIHTFPDYINITFRAVGTFDNPLNLCAFLVFPLGVLQYTINKTRSEKLLNLMIYLTLISTVSKIAAIIILISLLIYFKKYIKFIIYGIIAVILIGLVYINIPNAAYNKSYFYQRFNNQKVINESVDTRLYMLSSSVEIIKDNPFLGIGYENFEESYLKLNTKNNEIKLTKSSFTSENFLLDFYLDNGLIPCLIVFFFFLESVLTFYISKNDLIVQYSFSIVLFIVIGLIMSSRTAPILYLFFSYLAIISKIKKNGIKTVNNYN